jgi:glycolate oxidase FAD binding subunit
MVKQDTVLSELESIVGGQRVAPADGRYAVDGRIPAVVVSPGSYDEVAAVLRFAAERRLAAIPRGAGTMIGFGNPPLRYDIALDLSALNALVEHEPADLTVTCQAGMTIGALQEALGKSGQMVPLDPELPAQATVGGVLAVNAYGPARHTYGGARDFTIGMRVVTADGKITRCGGKVVKNVAGYDLCKLYIGSMGTLGVIVEATFKVLPLSAAERLLDVGFQSSTGACAFAREVTRRGLAARGFLLSGQVATQGKGRSPWLLRIDVAGSESAVARTSREVANLARQSGASLLPKRRADSRRAEPQPELVVRVSVLPTSLPALIDAIGDGAGSPSIAAYPTLGVAKIGVAAPDARALLERARLLARLEGGTCIVERCPLEMKGTTDVFGDTPASFALMRRLKQQFDPLGVLNPGRFAGRL